MGKKQTWKPHSEEKQKEYEREIRLQYGPDLVSQSVKRWGSYSQEQKDAVLEEGNRIYADLVEAIKDGKRPQGKKVQAILARWHEHIRYFYEPTLEILRGLGDLYTTHPDFIANFKKLHPELGDFMKEGIHQYVDDLETAEIERMLADDEARRLQG